MISLEDPHLNPAIERTLHEIQGASIPQLYNTIQTLLGERPYEASELIERSGKSLAEIVWEGQEGIHNYQSLLGLHGGDDSAVLGRFLVVLFWRNPTHMIRKYELAKLSLNPSCYLSSRSKRVERNHLGLFAPC